MQPRDLVQLAEQFGNPLYVYDAEKIQSQYLRLRGAFSKVERLRINYAVKALSNLAIPDGSSLHQRHLTTQREG